MWKEHFKNCFKLFSFLQILNFFMLLMLCGLLIAASLSAKIGILIWPSYFETIHFVRDLVLVTLICFDRSLQVAEFLLAMFKKRQVVKHYWVITKSVPKPQEGLWCLLILCWIFLKISAILTAVSGCKMTFKNCMVLDSFCQLFFFIHQYRF